MAERLTDVVTGAFSFTGRHIAEQLLAAGRRVRTLGRDSFRDWIQVHGPQLGRRYVSELARNYR